MIVEAHAVTVVAGSNTGTAKKTTKKIIVEYTETEAQHVEAALFDAYCRERNHGGVWLPLAHALTAAGIQTLSK